MRNAYNKSKFKLDYFTQLSSHNQKRSIISTSHVGSTGSGLALAYMLCILPGILLVNCLILRHSGVVDASQAGTVTMQLGDLEGQLQVIVTDINRFMSQLSNFTNQFQSFIIENKINVIISGEGSLEIDVPSGLSQSLAQSYANRINVLDSLIHNHIDSIKGLLTRGFELEIQIKQLNVNYLSQLSGHEERLAQLSYHYKL